MGERTLLCVSVRACPPPLRRPLPVGVYKPGEDAQCQGATARPLLAPAASGPVPGWGSRARTPRVSPRQERLCGPFPSQTRRAACPGALCLESCEMDGDHGRSGCRRGKGGGGGGRGERYLSEYLRVPPALLPAGASPWRGELPPARGALCSAANRAPKEPAASGAGRAPGGPALPLSGWKRVGRERSTAGTCFGALLPGPPRKRDSAGQARLGWGWGVIHSSTRRNR